MYISFMWSLNIIILLKACGISMMVGKSQAGAYDTLQDPKVRFDKYMWFYKYFIKYIHITHIINPISFLKLTIDILQVG